MRTSGQPRIVCAGGAVVDRKLLLYRAPVPGTSNPARSVTSFGGVARNVAESLARLGAAVTMVSRVGDDDAGRAVTAHLGGLGVDVRGVSVAWSGETAQYVAMLSPHGQLVVGAAAMDVLDGLAPSDLDACWPEPTDPPSWVFADCNLPIDTLGHAVRRARTAGTPLAVDAVSTPKVTRLPRDLGGVTVLFCNADEARALAAHHAWMAADSDLDLACLLHEEGAQHVVLTRGADGVIIADDDGPRLVPATAATVFDVTGAGDALVAGTLASLRVGASLDDAVLTGTLVAALTVESQHSVRPDLSAELADAAAVHRLRRPGMLVAAAVTLRPGHERDIATGTWVKDAPAEAGPDPLDASTPLSALTPASTTASTSTAAATPTTDVTSTAATTPTPTPATGPVSGADDAEPTVDTPPDRSDTQVDRRADVQVDRRSDAQDESSGSASVEASAATGSTRVSEGEPTPATEPGRAEPAARAGDQILARGRATGFRAEAPAEHWVGPEAPGDGGGAAAIGRAATLQVDGGPATAAANGSLSRP